MTAETRSVEALLADAITELRRINAQTDISFEDIANVIEGLHKTRASIIAEREHYADLTAASANYERDYAQAQARIRDLEAALRKWADASWRVEQRAFGVSAGDVIASEADALLKGAS